MTLVWREMMTLMKSGLLAVGTAAFAMLAVAGAQARTLDPAKPEDALEISKRLQCGVSEDEPAVYHWSGNIYGRSPGLRDKLLFKGEGMNIRRCVEVNDPQRGKGWRLVSREVMLMLDPKTGEVVRQWENPYTGETVEVMHIHNDPVNGRPNFARGADGSPFTLGSLREAGPYVFMPFEAPLFYTNPLTGDYQEYVGGEYHAMEIFDFGALKSDLYDSTKPTAYPMISWVRISGWAVDEDGQPSGPDGLQRDGPQAARRVRGTARCAQERDPRQLPDLRTSTAQGRCTSQRDDLDQVQAADR
jgi:hypothetical protein